MKNERLFFVLLLLLSLNACTSTKTVSNASLLTLGKNSIYFCSGIAFWGLFPDKKPTITFNKATQKVEGTNSCNEDAANYTLNSINLSLG